MALLNRLGNLLSKRRTPEPDAAMPATESILVTAEDHKTLGNKHLAKGELEAAAACYRQAIELDSNYADAFNNLGFIHLQQNRYDDAEHHFEHAVSLNPRLANAHFNLGTLFFRRGQLERARASFRQAVDLNPNGADAHYSLGNVLYELGQYSAAEDSLRRALALAPDFVNARNCLGLVLQRQGRLEPALACYQAAASLNPEFFVAHYNAGFVLRILGRHNEALTPLQKAIALHPGLAEAHYELGNLFAAQNQPDAAQLHYRQAISLQPDHGDAYNNLGLVLLRQDRPDEARPCFEAAIRIKPDMAAAYNNLADVLHKQGRLDESLAAIDEAIALTPELAGLYVTKGIVLQDLRRLGEAESCYRQALALEPETRPWQFNIALLLLARGQLVEGWKQYEFRFHPGSPARERVFPQHSWAGESLTGKSLLIWEDQGIGDEILFAALFQEMIDRAGRCVIECAPKLVPLFARSFPTALVVPRVDPLHPATLDDIDYQIAAGSLPLHLRSSLESFPRHDGYLKPDPERVAYWRTRIAELGPGLKVGFCWRSRLRTGLRRLQYTTLDQWGPIFGIPGAHFINLQYDDCTPELDEARRRFRIPLHAFDEVDLLDDLDEAAALTGALDLVVTAPTAAGRLAAAQGIATWEMSYGTSWTTLGTSVLPWLPAQRLFVRRWDQPWEEIIAAVANELERHVRAAS